jgi:hypothetical protein
MYFCNLFFLYIKVRFSIIENRVMIKYLIYKNKINNMKRLLNITSNSSEKHMLLGLVKKIKCWLNHCRVNENITCKLMIILKILLHLNLK